MYICDVISYSAFLLPEILRHQGNTYFRQAVSVIMVPKTSILSNLLYTPKYAFRSL